MATPLIAYWPRVIKDVGRITHQVSHIVDIMATCLDMAGAEYPASYNGRTVLPLEGKSLLPIFQGKKRRGHEVLYWQFGSSCAVRKGKWKLVCSHPNPRAGIDYFNEGDELKGKGNDERAWELYDMWSDRTETNNLADKYPQKVREMVNLYETWARHELLVKIRADR